MFSFVLGIVVGMVVGQLTSVKDTVTQLYKSVCLSNSLTKVTSNVYTLDYKYLGKPYSLLLKVRRGPRQIQSIVDDEGNDVTEEVRPFLGPNENGHLLHVPVTPILMGYPSLTLHTLKGETRTFRGEECIAV